MAKIRGSVLGASGPRGLQQLLAIGLATRASRCNYRWIIFTPPTKVGCLPARSSYPRPCQHRVLDEPLRRLTWFMCAFLGALSLCFLPLVLGFLTACSLPFSPPRRFPVVSRTRCPAPMRQSTSAQGAIGRVARGSTTSASS